MIKKYIKNKQGKVTHGGQFETQAECDAWISECKSNHAWGKPAGIYSESQLSEQELVGAVLQPKDPMFPSVEDMYEIQDQFVIEDPSVEEIAQEVAEKTKKKDKEDKRSLRIANIKVLDWSKINTVAELKPILKVLVEDFLKDEG